MDSTRLYQCPQCEKGFKELRTLRLHLKIHNAEYPERCLVCAKVFRTKWQLKQHQMDHGGERPYPCPECSFTCKTKQQLNEHRRKHSGEKAYSCQLCGTRFTYRNGLIKHTKLNRCPKKIVTADGETIIKKRSRVVTNKKQQQGPATIVTASPTTIAVTPTLNLQMSAAVAEAVNNVISESISKKNNLDQKILDAIRRRSSVKTIRDEKKEDVKPSDAQIQVEEMIKSENDVPTDPLAFNDMENSFNLALLDDGSACMVSTTCTLPTQTVTTKAHLMSPADSPSTTSSRSTTSSTVVAHNGVLPPNTINELSAATGLPSSEICSWAATLPAGATVKVTHHYNTSIEATPSLETTTQMILPTIINLPQQTTSLPEISGALRHSSMGLPTYQECFAVDPNEVLQNERSRFLLRPRDEPLIKKESSPSIADNCLEDFIDLDYGIVSDAETKPVIKIEPSSPIGSDSGLSNNSFGNSSLYSNSYYINNTDDTLADIDLSDCLNTNAVQHLDDALSVLNDEDFSSMKCIVEQTFKDGREIMDVISSV